MTNSSSSSTKEWFLHDVVMDFLRLRMILWEEEEGAGVEVAAVVMEKCATSDLKQGEEGARIGRGKVT